MHLSLYGSILGILRRCKPRDVLYASWYAMSRDMSWVFKNNTAM